MTVGPPAKKMPLPPASARKQPENLEEGVHRPRTPPTRRQAGGTVCLPLFARRESPQIVVARQVVKSLCESVSIVYIV